MRIGKNKKIEILSPAGSVSSLRAAILAGCDAVYIGGSRFGARAYAENPSEEELLEALDYAHSYGVKVYMTVNTLLKQKELSELISYLTPYYLRGIDAVIVQDFGVMQLLAQTWPDLPIHASTQMTITNAAACRLLPKSVTRIVPAREMNFSELRALREKTPLELEVFCHGALCYSYSGQCLMSSLIGGRSGNRGRCAQPCRKPYVCTAPGEKEQSGYFLGLKDQCMLSKLPELLALGIDSLKIEGRMKNALYTAGVTSIYRKWVNRLEASGAKNYRFEEIEELKEDIKRLAEFYNRGGFTEGYPFEEPGRKMISLARPNHSGVLVGEGRLLAGKGRCKVEYHQSVHAGDVLELRETIGTGERILAEYTAGADEMHAPRIVPLTGRGAAGNILVYRTKNDALLAEIAESLRKQSRKTPLCAKFYARTGEPMELSLTGEVFVSVKGAVAEAAQKAPATPQSIQASLQKTGDTPYRFASIAVELADDCFLPVSRLNELRRQALKRYTKKLLAKYHRKPVSEKTAPLLGEFGEQEQKNPTVSVMVTTPKQLRAVSAYSEIQRIYVDMEGDYKGCLQQNTSLRPWLALPRITQGKRLDELWSTLVELSQKNAFSGLLVRSLDALARWKEESLGVPLAADANLYAMNDSAASWLLRQGASLVTAPLEENSREMRWLKHFPFEMVVYGRNVVMVSRQCVWKTAYGCARGKTSPLLLQDEKGAKFPVLAVCDACYNRIHNSAPMSLLPYMESVAALSPASLRLEFTFEEESEVQNVLEHFLMAVQGKTVEECADQKETRGHFRRGVF